MIWHQKKRIMRNPVIGQFQNDVIKIYPNGYTMCEQSDPIPMEIIRSLKPINPLVTPQWVIHCRKISSLIYFSSEGYYLLIWISVFIIVGLEDLTGFVGSHGV